jgi:hypothetical protein
VGIVEADGSTPLIARLKTVGPLPESEAMSLHEAAKMLGLPYDLFVKRVDPSDECRIELDLYDDGKGGQCVIRQQVEIIAYAAPDTRFIAITPLPDGRALLAPLPKGEEQP